MEFVFAFDNRGGLAFAYEFDGFADAVDFLVTCDERWHGIDVIAEGAQPHSRFANHVLYIVGRRLRLEFQHTDGAENTDIGGVFETAERFQVLLQALFNPSDTRCIIATFEQRKRCIPAAHAKGFAM